MQGKNTSNHRGSNNILCCSLLLTAPDTKWNDEISQVSSTHKYIIQYYVTHPYYHSYFFVAWLLRSLGILKDFCVQCDQQRLYKNGIKWTNDDRYQSSVASSRQWNKTWDSSKSNIFTRKVTLPYYLLSGKQHNAILWHFIAYKLKLLSIKSHF